MDVKLTTGVLDDTTALAHPNVTPNASSACIQIESLSSSIEERTTSASVSSSI